MCFYGVKSVYGKGNYLKDTILPLYSITGQQTINMGVCGAGPDTTHNTIALIEKNYIQKVIICWPELLDKCSYNGAEINSGEKPYF